MQRYRVNYSLLIGLVVGFAVAAPALYFLWRYQVDRNADRLLAKAATAEAEGDYEQSFKSLDQYVQLRPNDADASRRLGESAFKVIELTKPEEETWAKAYQTAVTVVRDSDDHELRRKLVDVQTMIGAVELALIEIDKLLDAGKGDPELKALRAECLFVTQKAVEGAKWCYKLIGYDEKSDSFDGAKAETPNIPRVYALLAQHLRNTRQPELAQKVIDRMIEANPESREALVAQYQFLKQDGKNEEAREALEKAYENESTDAVVLTLKGVEKVVDYQHEVEEAGADADKRKAAEKHLDEAAKYFNDALARYPDRLDLYERSARVELFRDKPEEALAILQRGLDKFPLKGEILRTGLPRAIHLSNLKTEILVGQKNFDQVRESIKLLRSLNNPRLSSVADFHEARLMAIEEKWADAAAALRKVRNRLVGFPELEGLAGAIQGFCYTQMGQFDLALEAYEWALLKNPDLVQAQIGAQEMRAAVQPDAQDSDALALDEKIKAMMNKPPAEQDWNALYAEVDLYISEQAAKRPVSATWADARKALMRGQIAAMRAGAEPDEAKQKALYKEAREHIAKAYSIDKKDPQIQLMAIRLIAQEPDRGPSQALAQLDDMVKKMHGGKETTPFRLLRIDLLAAIRDEQLPSQLEAATQGMDDWPANQQAVVWAAVGGKYEQMGKFAESQRALDKAVELAPNSLPFRMSLFDLALKQADDAAMQRAQEKILEIVKQETAPNYVLTEVKRRIVGSQSGAVSPEELTEARAMLARAIKQRPNWSELHIASGQLYLVLEKDADKALASFDQAIRTGTSNLNAVALQVRLLADRGRLADARKRMESIPSNVWSAVLDRYAAEVLMKVGERDKAMAEAEKIAKARPEDLQTQLWYADVAQQAQKPEVAEKALKKAIELDPSSPDSWTRLVSVYLTLKQPERVESTLREAHLALDEEYLPLLAAKYYELQSRWQAAEDIYGSAYAGREQEIPVARRLAEFYLTWSNDNEANRGKAAIYLNRILRAGNEGKLPAGDPNLPWARRQAAKLLAMTREYANSLKAEKLLAAAIEGGTATPEDQEQLIDLLSLRNDPASRSRVVALLREIKQQRGLPPERELHLGHMLNEIDQWQDSKKQMMDAIGRYPEDVRLQTAYASMLIARKEFTEARSWIARINSNRAYAAAVGELELRLAAAQGNKEQVRAVLTRMTPNLNVLNQQQLEFLRSLVQLAENVGDHEFALKMMQEYARRAPGNELELARLTALYGDLDQGVELMRSQFDARMDDTLTVALEVLRKRRREAPEKLDAELSRMIRAALRDDPESARRLVFEAEMLEVQEKFEESISAYNRLLARDDVPALMRATALNNLAFILALQSKKPEDLELALKSVNEAIEIIGPLSDILDTRALVYIAGGQYEKAVEDMRLSVMVTPTPGKYYHLAMAELGAGNEAGAKAAWQRAEADGIAPEKVSELERKQLEEFSKKMQGMGASQATTPTAQL
jgi:cellulose synthase operon protein C